jgi:ACR3 family arsenite transporter
VLVYAVICFIVFPLTAGAFTRRTLIQRRGAEWFENAFLPRFHYTAVLALLATLVLIFAFQADNITNRFFHVVLIAIPILLQVYFNSSLVYGLMKLFRVPHSVAAPGALIGASNFFELAVATAIALYGPESGAALATVVRGLGGGVPGARARLLCQLEFVCGPNGPNRRPQVKLWTGQGELSWQLSNARRATG